MTDRHKCVLPMREWRVYTPGGLAGHVEHVPDGREGAVWLCESCWVVWVVRKAKRPRERGRVWNPNALEWHELDPISAWSLRRKLRSTRDQA